MSQSMLPMNNRPLGNVVDSKYPSVNDKPPARVQYHPSNQVYPSEALEAREQADLRLGDEGYVVYEQLSALAQAARRQSLNLEVAEEDRRDRAEAKKAAKAQEKEAARAKAAALALPRKTAPKSPRAAVRSSELSRKSPASGGRGAQETDGGK